MDTKLNDCFSYLPPHLLPKEGFFLSRWLHEEFFLRSLELAGLLRLVGVLVFFVAVGLHLGYLVQGSSGL